MRNFQKRRGAPPPGGPGGGGGGGAAPPPPPPPGRPTPAPGHHGVGNSIGDCCGSAARRWP
ncbi:hypothetical protein EJ815_07870, partial [Pseudomonas aeruginosa]